MKSFWIFQIRIFITPITVILLVQPTLPWRLDDSTFTYFHYSRENRSSLEFAELFHADYFKLGILEAVGSSHMQSIVTHVGWNVNQAEDLRFHQISAFRFQLAPSCSVHLLDEENARILKDTLNSNFPIVPNFIWLIEASGRK